VSIEEEPTDVDDQGLGSDDGPIEFDVRLLAGEIDQAGAVAKRAMALAEDASARVEKTEGYVVKIIEMLDAAPGGPWDYARIGPERTEELLTELGEWVSWLEGRYLVHMPSEYELPECWFEHPVAVEVLTALMVSHRAAYTASTQIPSDILVRWHSHCLEPAWYFLKQAKIFNKCAEMQDGHAHATPPRPRHHSAEKFAEFVGKSVSALADEAQL